MSKVRTRGHERVKVETLKEWPGNPRRGDVEAIRESIRVNGFRGALVVQEATRRVLSGNHTLRAARAENMTEVPVVWQDVDDQAAARIVLAFNKAADLGYYDNDLLADLLEAVGPDGLEGTLYASGDLDVILAAVRDSNTPDPDERGMRSIIVPLAIEEYEAAVRTLIALRNEWGVDSNTEVMLRALADADGGSDDDG